MIVASLIVFSPPSSQFLEVWKPCGVRGQSLLLLLNPHGDTEWGRSRVWLFGGVRSSSAIELKETENITGG